MAQLGKKGTIMPNIPVSQMLLVVSGYTYPHDYERHLFFFGAVIQMSERSLSGSSSSDAGLLTSLPFCFQNLALGISWKCQKCLWLLFRLN